MLSVLILLAPRRGNGWKVPSQKEKHARGPHERPAHASMLTPLYPDVFRPLFVKNYTNSSGALTISVPVGSPGPVQVVLGLP